MSNAGQRRSLVAAAAIVALGAMFLVVLIVNQFTGFLDRGLAGVPVGVRRGNFFLLPVLAAMVALRNTLPPVPRAAAAGGLCLSALLFAASARQDVTLATVVVVVLYVEVFWLVPRLNKRSR